MEGALCGSFRSYADLMNDDKAQRKLDWIARRTGQFERSFNRSLKEMKALKAEELKRQPPQPTFAEMSPEQLKAMAERIMAERKTKISERSQPEAAHTSAFCNRETDSADMIPPDYAAPNGAGVPRGRLFEL